MRCAIHRRDFLWQSAAALTGMAKTPPPKRRPPADLFGALTDKIETSARPVLLPMAEIESILHNAATDPVDEVRRAAQAARRAQDTEAANVWTLDATRKGIDIASIADLTESHAIFPYLFRKILDHAYTQQMERYWAALRGELAKYDPEDECFSLDGLFDGGNPYLFIPSAQDFMRLDQIVLVDGQKLRLRTLPDDWVFLF